MGTAAFLTRFVLAALATWRITHLLAREDGPGDAVFRLRRRAGNGFFGRLLDCFYCLSLWVAAPFALLVTRAPLDLVLCWFALSGAACLLERIGAEPVVIAHADAPPAGDSRESGVTKSDEGGTENGMLRPETGRAAEADGRTGAADESVAADRIPRNAGTAINSIADRVAS